MAKGKYAWGDGRGKVHSIPLATHKQNQQALHALGGSTDLTAPPTGIQAYREATAAADSQFGPQVQAAQQLQTNVEPWFKDYMARVAGYASAAQAQSAPVLQQAGAYQQGAAAQTAPGLDPNSDAGKQAAQAASGRQALAQLGLDALNANATATQDLFKGQQSIAARELPEAMTAAAQRTAGAKSQRNSAVTGFLTTARQNAQNYAIARGTLNLNTDKAISDANATAATTTEKTRHDKATETTSSKNADTAATQGYRPGGTGLNKYGFTYAEWTALSPKDKTKARAGKPKTAAPQSPEQQASDDFYNKYGVRPATTTQVHNAHDAVQAARATVKSILASNKSMSRSQLGPLLLNGQAAATNPKTGQKGMAIPKVRGLWATVALDMAFLGGISAGTANRLHHSGYTAQQLGLPLLGPTPKVKPAPVLTNNPLTGASNPLGR